MDDRAELIRRLRDGICTAPMVSGPGVRPDLTATVTLMAEAAEALEASHPVRADRVEIAKIIDPHSFCDIPFTDEQALLDMVEQSKEDALRKADRILSALAAAPEAPGQEAFSGYGKFTPISVGADTKSDPSSSSAGEKDEPVAHQFRYKYPSGHWGPWFHTPHPYAADFIAVGTLLDEESRPLYLRPARSDAEMIRQEGFEAGLKAAVDRYADAETWDYFLAAEEAILALSTKGAAS